MRAACENQYLRLFLLLISVRIGSLILPAGCAAQAIPFRRFQLADGLVSNNVNAICQDSLGYLWIGTMDGISRFDSKEFVNFTTADGLSSNNITSIVADRNEPGQVWIATDGEGVERYYGGRFERIKAVLTPKQRHVNALYQDAGGRLWCGNEDGIFVIDHDSLLSSVKSTSGLHVKSICGNDEKEIFICSGDCIYALNGGEDSLPPRSVSGKFGSEVTSLFVDRGKNLWFSTADGMIGMFSKCDPARLKTVRTGVAATDFSEEADGTIWISSDRGMLTTTYEKFCKGLVARFSSTHGLPTEQLNVVMVDREGVIWAGSLLKGVVSLPITTLLRFNFKHSRSLLWSSAICDTTGHFFVTDGESVMELFQDKSDIWHFVRSNSVGTNHSAKVIHLSYDSGNDELICGYSSGKITFFRIRHSPGNTSNLIRVKELDLRKHLDFHTLQTVYPDRNGNMWCSLIDLGVAVIRPVTGRVQRVYTARDGLPDNSIRSIFQDSFGNIWFGGFASGVSIISPAGLHGAPVNSASAPTRRILHNKGVRAIEEGERGTIIIGTRYSGLDILRGDSDIEVPRTEGGLMSNGVWDIQPLGNSRFWLCTQAGVQELILDRRPHFETLEQVPRVPYYSAALSKESYLCFASGDAAFIYRVPVRGNTEAIEPTYITRIVLNGKVIKPRQGVHFPDDVKNITFDFVSISNKVVGRAYRYRLINEEAGFRTLYNRSSVTYASLPPGRYEFQVYGGGPEEADSKPADFSFVIDAPFYSRWWFITSSVILGLLMIFSMVFQRMRRRAEVAEIRNRIAMDLHDEIGSGLTKIAMLSEYGDTSAEFEGGGPGPAAGEKPTGERARDRVGKIARELVDSMADVVWSIDPNYDTLSDFVFYFKVYANELADAKNIGFVMETDLNENPKIDVKIKRNLQLLSKEALNNAVKYSGCKIIRYSLSVQNKVISLVVDDDGCGFDPAEVERGNGLNNMEKHAGELSGTYSIESSPGKGTKIRISFPI